MKIRAGCKRVLRPAHAEGAVFMIKHIYLFRLKDPGRLREAASTILTLKEHIPYLVSLEVGIDFKGAENSFQLCEICVFRNMEDFRRFGVDPYHAKIRTYMDGIRETSVKIDFETGDE